MKKHIIYLCLLSLMSFLSSCFYIEEPNSNTTLPKSQYTPVYMNRTALNQSVKHTAAQELKSPGKIYTYGRYLFINDSQRGIHVFDNQDPANPINLTYIEIPGNVDMAIKDNILYVDNAVDLVALDISNINDIREVSRKTDIFPMGNLKEAPDGFEFEYDATKGYIVYWIKMN